MTTPANHRCTQEGCSFSDTGECLENLPPEDCSHLVELIENTPAVDDDLGLAPPAVDDEHFTAEPSAYAQEDEMVPIYAAAAFEPPEADELAAKQECTLVVIAGDVDSGKTTLVGRCFAQFFDGPTSGWLFAGSRTLLGFDERIHNHRIGSRRARAETRHTPKGVELYYHLDLRSTDGMQKRTLLIHDISGENYQDAIDKSSGAEALTMVRRADAVSFLLNGRDLLNLAQRAAASSSLIDIVQALAEQNYLQHAPLINVVVTCWDYIVEEKKTEDVNDFLDGFEKRVKELLQDYQVGSAVVLDRVASVTHFKETEAGFGFGRLFESWIATRPKPVPVIRETLSGGGRGEGWTEVSRHREEPSE